MLPVGQGVAEDLRQIARCFPEVTNPGVPKGGADPGCRGGAFVDLAAVVDFYDVPASGLGRLAQHCGFSDVSKPKSVQVSDWSRTPLTDAQVRYAAQDACLSLWVLERLFAIYAPPGVNLATWASAFAGCETRKDVASRCKRLDGVIDGTMRAHMRARLERWRDEEGDANYVKAFRKCSLALARHDAGVDAGERGVNARSTLAQLAQYLNVRIRFDHARDRDPDGGLKGAPTAARRRRVFWTTARRSAPAEALTRRGRSWRRRRGRASPPAGDEGRRVVVRVPREDAERVMKTRRT